MPSAVVSVRVRPGARQSELLPPVGGEWRLAIAAPPVGGKANAACAALLAELLDVRRAQITLASGQTNRRKRFRVDGLDSGEIESRLRAHLYAR